MIRLGVVLPTASPPGPVLGLARTAEELGYGSVWSTQLADAPDAALVLAACASATSRIGLGTSVLPIFARHPVAMVQMAATLDELSGGRFTLGIGVSHPSTVEGMLRLRLDRPLEAMREYLTIVRAGLREGMVELEGQRFGAHWVYSGERRPDLRVLVGAVGPRMLELAGELADGVTLWLCSAEHVRDRVLPHLRRGRGRAGLPIDGFEIAVHVPIAITANPGPVLDAQRRTIYRYAKLPSYRRLLLAGGLEDAVTPRMSDGTVRALAAIGDLDEVRTALDRYREAGCTLPLISPIAPDVRDFASILGRLAPGPAVEASR